MKMQANTTLFFYQNGKITTVSEKGRPRTIFRADDQPLAEQHAGDAGTPGLLATDDKGSVLSVQSNDKEEDHAFSAYGHDPSLPSKHTMIGFNGQRIEAIAMCYPLGSGYRLYSPLLMRFLSPDTLSPFDQGGLNTYAYCGNEPVNHLDPTGHWRSLVPRSIKHFFAGHRPSSKFTEVLTDSRSTAEHTIFTYKNPKHYPNQKISEKTAHKLEKVFKYNEKVKNLESEKNNLQKDVAYHGVHHEELGNTNKDHLALSSTELIRNLKKLNLANEQFNEIPNDELNRLIRNDNRVFSKRRNAIQYGIGLNM